MAVPLTRISWTVLKKNQFQYKQFLTTSSSNCFPRYKHTYSQEQKPRYLGKTVRNALLYTVFVSGFGYILYKWKDDYQNRFRNLKDSVFTIHAKAVSWDGGNNNNRNRYNFIADVVEVSAPAVVYIEIQNNRRLDFYTGKPFNISNGSGFIVEADGLILTNAHVVTTKPNTTVKVRLNDGSMYTGTVEDIDVHSDLATVRINKTNLPVMKLGSSSNLRPGEFVVAIGSPLALSNTITSGVISSVNRHSEELGLFNKQMAYIQTDAAITFGNSGGPLVNLNGEAIGINAMKVTSGISFAIPIDHAKEFLKKAELRRKGKGARSASETRKTQYIGVTMLSLTPDLFYELQKKLKGIPHNIRHGVVIYKVLVGSPAHIGGLQAGDIITHVNDEPVVSSATIYKAMETCKILRMTVIRGMEVLHLRIEPEET
ncbi:serine protease HTRA2, mitochondrial isoform X2 [Ceratina calcarata]|uniref:Serine protease HTRA2, mitochondrial n=1 Tax=Ceratina calcarata TaxID=156304 RepID=A0AAJ7N567_9HYME|nr:serine protease HTRA2, mitochondrial isoform X2 [Ceratina calcarata]